jgi:hypothetical protein
MPGETSTASHLSAGTIEGGDATISAVMANAIGVGVLVCACAVFVPSFLLSAGSSALVRGAVRFTRWYELVPVFAALIVMHELLHAAGFILLGRVQRSAIRFGFQWKTVTPYAHCSVPVAAGQYRMAVALPGLLLGLVPCIIAVTIGSGWLLIWGVLMSMAAGGDVAILWAIRTVDRDAPVLDHPTKAGCLVGVSGDIHFNSKERQVS